jgi:hypothetical protein
VGANVSSKGGASISADCLATGTAGPSIVIGKPLLLISFRFSERVCWIALAVDDRLRSLDQEIDFGRLGSERFEPKIYELLNLRILGNQRWIRRLAIPQTRPSS